MYLNVKMLLGCAAERCGGEKASAEGENRS